MPRGGRRKAAGRKPTGRSKVAMLTRIAPETRKALEDARGPNKSLSQVADEMLREGLKAKAKERRDAPMVALCYLIAETANACRAFTGPDGKPLFDWHSDPFVFRAFKLAVAQLLDWLEPPGEIQSIVDRVGEDTFRNTPAGIVDSYRTPEARAQAAAMFIWSKVQAPPTDDELELAENWKPFGDRIKRMAVAMSDVRRDLNINPKRGVDPDKPEKGSGQ
jgi:hypothetical protein